MSARVTLDTEFFCRCYAVQPRDFSLCRIRVTLDTVYDCRCYAFICGNVCEVAGLAAVVLLEIPPNCLCGRECSPSLDQLHAFRRRCKSVPEYSNLCIRLNSSKIHNSNNNVTACAAPFIPPRSSQLQTQCTYQLPQPRVQYPLSFEYPSSCTLNVRVFLLLQ